MTNFIVKVTEGDWNALKLSDPIRRRTALSALYNGYGFEQLRTLMSKSMDSKECVELREVADFLGLLPTDDIIRGSYDHNQPGDGKAGL